MYILQDKTSYKTSNKRLNRKYFMFHGKQIQSNQKLILVKMRTKSSQVQVSAAKTVQLFLFGCEVELGLINCVQNFHFPVEWDFIL